MKLALYTNANREFFEPGKAPSRGEWKDWIARGVVKGKLIDDKPYVDLNWFAANDVMQPVQAQKTTVMDLLR